MSDWENVNTVWSAVEPNITTVGQNILLRVGTSVVSDTRFCVQVPQKHHWTQNGKCHENVVLFNSQRWVELSVVKRRFVQKLIGVRG
ncbi:hypothetical protein chiPu_0024467 [Chiloscyllium punctatum]|uniref:Uncharacterized protein n=1 Tax=Chiloscyllium punctatum TaxID=137246 RepID=A0A401TDG8_CHIPU|nr:hypothetical protein [Chiloscyllium punctatum]